jgi:hypothetical protein
MRVTSSENFRTSLTQFFKVAWWHWSMISTAIDSYTGQHRPKLSPLTIRANFVKLGMPTLAASCNIALINAVLNLAGMKFTSSSVLRLVRLLNCSERNTPLTKTSIWSDSWIQKRKSLLQRYDVKAQFKIAVTWIGKRDNSLSIFRTINIRVIFFKIWLYRPIQSVQLLKIPSSEITLLCRSVLYNHIKIRICTDMIDAHHSRLTRLFW